MANPSSHDADTSSAPSSSTALLMIGTVADTTWRLFVPTIGGAILGIWVGNTYDSQPWTTVVGVFTGFVIAAVLIYLQIRKVQN